MVDHVEGQTFYLQKLLGKLKFQYSVEMSSQLQNDAMPTCWKMLRQKIEKFSVVGKNPNLLQKMWGSKPEKVTGNYL